MIHPVIKLDERTGTKFLYLVPETELEEKFILWFCHQHDLPRQRINRKESIRFPIYNDPEDTQKNIYAAFHEFKEKFRYVEIPNLTGLTQDDAAKELRLRGLGWDVHSELESRAHPAGFVVGQHPSAGSAVVSDSTVRLVLSRGPGPPPKE